MTDIDRDDVAAMRSEGDGSDFRRFMRQQIATGRARRDAKPKPATAPPPPGHQPGAWPTGTHPPGPLPPQPPGTWEDALDRYRAGHGSDHDPCPCGGCPPPDKPKETQ